MENLNCWACGETHEDRDCVGPVQEIHVSNPHLGSDLDDYMQEYYLELAAEVERLSKENEQLKEDIDNLKWELREEGSRNEE